MHILTHRFELVLGLVELHDEVAVVHGLVLDHHLEPHGEALKVVVHPLQSCVQLKWKYLEGGLNSKLQTNVIFQIQF